MNGTEFVLAKEYRALCGVFLRCYAGDFGGVDEGKIESLAGLQEGCFYASAYDTSGF